MKTLNKYVLNESTEFPNVKTDEWRNFPTKTQIELVTGWFLFISVQIILDYRSSSFNKHFIKI